MLTSRRLSVQTPPFTPLRRCTREDGTPVRLSVVRRDARLIQAFFRSMMPMVSVVSDEGCHADGGGPGPEDRYVSQTG
jgi:hypothetical protein